MAKIYDFIGLAFDPSYLDYSKNEKFKGKYGDPTGIHESNTPKVKSINNWESLKSHPYWSEFLFGYSDYLGAEFLKKYGNYTPISQNKKDKSFKMIEAYLKKSKWTFKEHEVPKWELVKYSLLRRLGLSNF
jgi:hypothetical protein